MSTIHSAIPDAAVGEFPADADADAAVRQLYAHHAQALHSYVLRFCADRAARSRPVTVPVQPAEDGRADSGLPEPVDHACGQVSGQGNRRGGTSS